MRVHVCCACMLLMHDVPYGHAEAGGWPGRGVPLQLPQRCTGVRAWPLDAAGVFGVSHRWHGRRACSSEVTTRLDRSTKHGEQGTQHALGRLAHLAGAQRVCIRNVLTGRIRTYHSSDGNSTVSQTASLFVISCNFRIRCRAACAIRGEIRKRWGMKASTNNECVFVSTRAHALTRPVLHGLYL